MYPFKKKPVKGKKHEWYYSDEYRGVCLVLERVLHLPAEDLFPKHLYDHLVGTETEKVVEVVSFTALSTAVRRKVLALPAPTEEGPEAKADEVLLRDRIRAVLKQLPYREREIIKLRFGLGQGYSYTFEEISLIFKVGRERISQIEAKAIRRLQQPLLSLQLRPFL